MIRVKAVWITSFILLLGILPIGNMYAQVTGKAFLDINGDGTQQTTGAHVEPGYAGVTVTGYGANGTVYGPTTTSSTGTYTLAGVNQATRIEFTWSDPDVYSGAAGGTTVQFVTGSATNINLPLINPGLYANDTNPRVAMPMYVNGDNQASGTAAAGTSIFAFKYDTTGKTAIGTMGQVGAVWGTAYHRPSGKMFYAAFGRRHVSWGPLGPNGIYVTSNAQTVAGTGSTGNFVDLNAINSAFDAGTPARNFNPGLGDKTQPNYDENMILGAGTTGLGDLDASDDGQYLFTVNLNDRKVWRIEVGTSGTAPTSASQVVAYSSLPNPCTSSTFRPFALKYYKGEVYTGGVCDGVTNLNNVNSAVDRTNLKAVVYKTDAASAPGSATWTKIFEMPLTFNRDGNFNKGHGATGVVDYIDPNGTINGLSMMSWHPWARKFADLRLNYATNTVFYAQPMLTDIEMDVDGSMILGFADRSGFQSGNENYGITGTTTYYGTAPGDILRVYNNNGTYVLENNGSAGGITTGGAGNGDGPGGGEFYFHDRFDAAQGTAPIYVDCVDCNHDETSVGGLALLPGAQEVLNSVFDPADNWDSGGLRWYSNTDGTAHAGLRLYVATITAFFGKAAGVGDVEVMLEPAPIEIGNRVWLDTDNDGIQDAGEAGISGVQVQLIKSGTTISTATTDASGNYIFSNATGTSTTSKKYGITQLVPNMAYTVRFPTTATVSGTTYNLTTAAAGSNRLIDSNAPANGDVTVLATDIPVYGANNHSFDTGYSSPPCSINSFTVTPACNNNGTPGDSADDYRTFSVTASGTSVAATYNASVNNSGTLTPTSGSYGSATNFRLQNGSAGNGTSYTLTLTDATTSSCTQTATISDPGSCSANGSLRITKAVTGKPVGFSSPNFTIHVDCSVNSFDQDITLTDGGSQTITNIPAGTTCTVTEPSTPTPPSGYSYGAPTISPSGAQTITDGTIVTVAVTNPLTQNPVCSLSVTATPGACSSATNTYIVTGQFTFANAPTSGTLSATIGASSSTPITMTGTTTSPQSYTITGLTADGASHTVNASFSASPTCSGTVNYTAPNSCTVTGQPDLQLTKTASTTTVISGQTFSYTLTLTNNGTLAATGVQVRDLLPASLTYVSSTASQGSYNNTTGIWTVGTVAVGASLTLTINVTVN